MEAEPTVANCDLGLEVAFLHISVSSCEKEQSRLDLFIFGKWIECFVSLLKALDFVFRRVQI